LPALAAGIARGLAGAGESAAIVRRRVGTYADLDAARAYLDLVVGDDRMCGRGGSRDPGMPTPER
jgi:hypothetical protein